MHPRLTLFYYIIIIVATIEETIEGMSNPLPAPVKECQRIDNFIAPKYG